MQELPLLLINSYNFLLNQQILLIKRVKQMLDQHTMFEANDQMALINAITMTDVTYKKMKLYAGLAEDTSVRDFFQERADLMEKVNVRFRKELERVGGRK